MSILLQNLPSEKLHIKAMKLFDFVLIAAKFDHLQPYLLPKLQPYLLPKVQPYLLPKLQPYLLPKLQPGIPIEPITLAGHIFVHSIHFETLEVQVWTMMEPYPGGSHNLWIFHFLC